LLFSFTKSKEDVMSKKHKGLKVVGGTKGGHMHKKHKKHGGKKRHKR
jgi:hypothetical protein